MSRYTAPRVKKLRALGVDLPGLSRKTIERRPYPPGQHGQSRRKYSDFCLRLMEKQKLQFNYGVTEKQMRRLVREAVNSKAASGKKLLQLLESRLDNAVFRAGFARTIPAARQLVNHGHFLVNGKRVDIPSFRVSSGDTIKLRERSKENAHVAASLGDVALDRPAWLSYDDGTKEASLGADPDDTSVPFPIEVRMVIEYYAQRL